MNDRNVKLKRRDNIRKFNLSYRKADGKYHLLL